MIEEYYGCFANNRCEYYGYKIVDCRGQVAEWDKGFLNKLIKRNGPLIAKWTVKYK